MSTQPEQRTGTEASPWVRRGLSALAGLLSAAVALGIGELLAGLVSPNSSPVIAIGGAVIDATPRPLKDFAITTFGQNDKVALVVGTLVLLAGFSMVLGVLAWSRLKLAAAGVLLFGVLGAAAAITRPTGSFLDVLPSIVGAATGAAALIYMITELARRTATPAGAERVSVASGKADKPIATSKALEAAADRASAAAATRQHADETLIAKLRERLAGVDRKTSSLNRRGFFVAGGLAAGAAVVAGGAGKLLQRRFAVSGARSAITLPDPSSPAPALPAGADLSKTVDGLTRLFTDNNDFYRVDTAITAPQVSPSDWSLRIFGMVDKEVQYTFADLMNRDDLIERDITISCVSNQVGDKLAGTARWIGVPLKNLLDEAGIKSGSDQLVSRSVDGMTIGTATDSAMNTEDAMIAIGMNGEPLVVDHGFPARMIIPGLYGYVSACKWIVEIEATTFDAFDAYWVERDWDREAPIKVFSRIDTPQGLRPVKSGPRMLAGIAWAQTRGIAQVEVKVDGADWAQASLSPEVNKNLWRQWTYPVDFAAGSHTIVVRSTDQAGELQTEERVDPFPNGATGWHNIVATVSDSL
ncbi:MAG: molybdopterin-dependent oxidoreductase [Geodermatophilaceae bacterium]|nr:molybdopterin-dependent oxidoreductase [Geodermatophilaceae bacterium]